MPFRVNACKLKERGRWSARGMEGISTHEGSSFVPRSKSIRSVKFVMIEDSDGFMIIINIELKVEPSK